MLITHACDISYEKTKRSFIICHILLLGAHVKRIVVFYYYYYYIMVAKSQKRNWTDEEVGFLIDLYEEHP